MAHDISKIHRTQLRTISRTAEKMRREYYTTNTERMLAGGSTLSSDQESLLLYRSNEEYMEYLKDWHFVKFLIDAFKNPLLEILEKSNMVVSLSGRYKKQEEWINKQIQKVDLKNEIINDLENIIYYGRFFRLPIYSESDRSFSLVKIKDETTVNFAYQMGEHIGYIVNPGSDSEFLTRSKGIGAAFKFRDPQYKSLDETDPEIQQELSKRLNLGDIEDFLKDDIVAMEMRTPSSTFYSQAGLLFKLYINEVLSQFSSLRDTFKQNLLAVSLSGSNKNTNEAARVVQAIENSVNQDSSVIFNQSVPGLINQMLGKTLNDTRVLPMIDEYSNVNLLKWNDRSDDKQRLDNETESLRSQVMSGFGVPEELIGISSNRWEILSKSDRYLTTISTYTDTCTNIVKSFVQCCLLHKCYDVPFDDIIFNFRNDTEIQAQMSRHNVDSMDASLSKLNNMLNNVKYLISLGFMDPEKVLEEFIDKAQSEGLMLSKAFRSKEDIMQFLMNGGM